MLSRSAQILGVAICWGGFALLSTRWHEAGVPLARTSQLPGEIFRAGRGQWLDFLLDDQLPSFHFGIPIGRALLLT